jgi:pimeloyl-ACP methyl ester carboxylesterase
MIFETNGVSLRYETTGNGEPLLWLHGFLGAGEDWRHIFPAPPAGYRLIAPDLRGHGASTNPSGRFSFRQASADVLALLDHLEVKSARAIGLSGGGITLLHMATAAPRSLASMVIVSAPPYFPEQARAVQRQASPTMLSVMEMDMMRRRHARGSEQIDELFAQARAMAEVYDDVNFTTADLATIEAETLIVFGDRDPLYPVSIALDLYLAIPRAALWVVPNAGHGPIFRDLAPGFAATALGFLAKRQP